MSDGRRPGGLTTLAVLNFIFGAWGLLYVVILVGAMRSEGGLEREMRLSLRADSATLWAHLMLRLLTAVLLIVSAVGYMGQKRFLGRVLGNAYAVVALLSTGLTLTHAEFDGGTLIGLVYPVLTLVLINTTFRDDLVSYTLSQGATASRESAFTGLHADHVGLVARYGMRFAIRTGSGLSTLLAVLIIGLGAAAVTFRPVELLMEQAPGLGHDRGEVATEVERVASSRSVARVVTEVTGSKGAQVDYLLRDNPALLTAIFFILIWIMPLLACLNGNNQTSGDIGNRGLRYLLLRTERPNIFLGRFLGTLAFLAASLVILLVLLVTYVGLKFGIYPLGAMAWWGLQAYGAFLAMALVYTALCAWISSAFDSSGGSLVLCLLATVFPIVFVKMAAGAFRQEDDAWDKVLPWGWKYDLLSHDVGTRLIAYAVMLGFTLLFLTLGARTFRRRDL
jgi:hypothetical protein